MIVGVTVNSTKDQCLSYAKDIEAWLKARGYQLAWEDEAYKGDFLVVLGGDGTMLRASKMAAKYNIPMLGINLGNLGYLTDSDRNEGLNAIAKVLAGDYRQEQRMMLKTREELALNEVFLRGEASKLASYKIDVGNGHMDTLRADGILVATPTGSTAYNLSAGGPILKPDSEMMVITPVCPHTLYARPWVVSGNDEVSITPMDEDAAVVLDGEVKFHLKKGESLTISRAECRATIIKTTNIDFFEVLRKKMGNAR